MKDQYIVNLTIEDVDLAPVIAYWMKEKLCNVHLLNRQ